MTAFDANNLARGRRGEKLVARWLSRWGYFWVPSYDYTGTNGDKAPRLFGFAERFPIPDLDVCKDGRRFWFEIKTKGKPTPTRITGTIDHGIDTRLIDAYQKVQKHTGCPVWIGIYEENSGDLLVALLDDLPLRQGTGAGAHMSYFPRDALQLVANFGAAA
jgi:hypothetical protein